MATLEKNKVKLMNITINVPDSVGEEINKSPNRKNLGFHDLKIIFENYEKSKKVNTTNKRQEMLNRIKKNKEFLVGTSDQILKDSKDFRENFVFTEDK